jgi:hypothetical protein
MEDAHVYEIFELTPWSALGPFISSAAFRDAPFIGEGSTARTVVQMNISSLGYTATAQSSADLIVLMSAARSGLYRADESGAMDSHDRNGTVFGALYVFPGPRKGEGRRLTTVRSTIVLQISPTYRRNKHAVKDSTRSNRTARM